MRTLNLTASGLKYCTDKAITSRASDPLENHKNTMTTVAEENHDSGDRSMRFVFEETDIRGETVHLDKAFRDVLATDQYAPPVSRLLGEFLAAAVLLSTTLKFDGKLILQVRSQGQIPLLMVECTSRQEIRAIARGADQATSENFEDLLANGQLAVTIDPDNGERYQGIVPLEGGSLATSLEAYFAQSEQLKTRLWLAADENHAAGMLLQQLPTQLAPNEEERQMQWEHACTLAETLHQDELLQLKAEQILHRLYHEDPLRVFPPGAVVFSCSCSKERTLSALAALGTAELLDILEEQGSIAMDCEFCNQRYIYYREDLQPLLDDNDTRTLH
jgi:molecular chaperone Hsp33